MGAAVRTAPIATKTRRCPTVTAESAGTYESRPPPKMLTWVSNSRLISTGAAETAWATACSSSAVRFSMLSAITATASFTASGVAASANTATASMGVSTGRLNGGVVVVVGDGLGATGGI